MSNLYDLISEIRNHIQNDDVYRELTSSNDKRKKHKILCSALDVANDIDEAIHAYLKLTEFEGRGMNYIYIYGIINSLQSQTMAVKFIYNFFLNKNLDIEKENDLNIVRVLRNKVLAHSVESGTGFGIVAMTIKTFSFQPHSFQKKYGLEEHNEKDIYEKIDLFSKNQYQGDHFTVDIKKLIENHQIALGKYLKEVVDSLPKLNE